LQALLRGERRANASETLQFSAVAFDDGFAAFVGTPGEHVHMDASGRLYDSATSTLLVITP
jgi:hypothetical protein